MSQMDGMKLARVVDACGEIDGRVKMQKIVYLLKAMGYDLPYDDFRIRQLGPYSRAVACDTDMLRRSEILTEVPKELGQRSGGEPVMQYSYRVRESVVALIRKHFDIASPEGSPSLEDMCQELTSNDRAVLEVAATKVFLKREDNLRGGNLDAELELLKGHLSNRFKEADDLLQGLPTRQLL